MFVAPKGRTDHILEITGPAFGDRWLRDTCAPAEWQRVWYPMYPIDIRVSAVDLAGILGAMRQWLDHNHLTPSLFHTARDGPDHAIVHTRFAVQDHAELFRTRFSPL
jgi:hypothetical protein